MGQRASQFSIEELKEYEELTYFTKAEVLRVHDKFKALAPEKVGHNRNAKLPQTKLLAFPPLTHNPFADRLCTVFSSSQDGDCTFEDFLDMMSVFSRTAPKEVKAEQAFRIFDFDGDDMIGYEDLKQILNRIIGPDHHLNDMEIRQMITGILQEADWDDDGALSYSEFEQIFYNSPDFLRALTINI